MSIENPTLVHFRHFTRQTYGGFSSLFTNLPSTFVERPLQIHPFYAKQSQLLKSQMNVNPYNTRDYENIANWTLGENKPNTKPIKANFKGKKMLLSTFLLWDVVPGKLCFVTVYPVRDSLYLREPR